MYISGRKDTTRLHVHLHVRRLDEVGYRKTNAHFSPQKRKKKVHRLDEVCRDILRNVEKFFRTDI
jgi:hypothetical protein